MQKRRQITGIIISVIILTICFSPQGRMLLSLPENQRLVVGETSNILLNLPPQLDTSLEMQIQGTSRSVFATPHDSPVSVNRNENGYEIAALKPGKVDIQLKLMGYIPIKSISIESMPTQRVVPGGHSIGVVLQSNGIMVVGFAPVVNVDGVKIYPARDSGIEIGDLIMEVNGNKIQKETDLAVLIDKSKNETIKLKIKRREKDLLIPIKAVLCPETQRYRIGLYVRDGVVGVGTLTFWEPDSNHYAALGHIIVDTDTRQGIDVRRGKIVSASIQAVKAGKPGRPGEKIGVFDSDGQINGSIEKNGYFGIYGTTSVDISNNLYDYPMEVAYAHQVKEGKAEIYTVVNGIDIEKFDIEIEKVYPERQNGKGMVIKVIDPRLLSLTGGIIQGMSGSPIIQEGRIVGAVTHVFLNDPQRGYGIFMDNMLSEMTGSTKEYANVSTN